MATAVMRDATISMRGKKYHLVFPCVGAQWPAMAENNRLPFAPILVVNLCTVFGRDRCHKTSPYVGDERLPVCVLLIATLAAAGFSLKACEEAEVLRLRWKVWPETI